MLSIRMPPLSRRLLVVLVPVGTILISLWTFGAFEPFAPPTDVVVSNLTDRSATISWKTAVPTKTKVLTSSTGSFPLFAFGTGRRDDLVEQVGQDTRLIVHHATLRNLEPATPYGVKIYRNFWRSQTYRFTTLSDITNLPTPSLAYGKIVDAQRQKGEAGVVVYLTITEEEKVATLSTLTSGNGSWQLDLSTARGQDGTALWPASVSTTIELIVEAGGRGKVRTVLSAGKLTPAPDIVLQRKNL